jgi:ribosomal protein S27AE
MAIVYCGKCGKVVKAGSGAKVKFNFVNPRRPNMSGTFCTACGEALVRSAHRKPAASR